MDSITLDKDTGIQGSKTSNNGQSEDNRSLDILGDFVKRTWATRHLSYSEFRLGESTQARPEVGDLALVRVGQVGYHDSVVTIDNRKLRIYPGDLLIGVFGNRYATDAYEGVVDGYENLSLLTAGGMVGTVLSKHRDIERPTSVSFVGYISDAKGQRVNLKEMSFRKSVPNHPPRNLIVVIGTGMNTGKTTVSRKIIKGLSNAGLKVVASKLTGSVSNRDQDEMRSASARAVIDFSDYGFPSTYLSSKEELIDLFNSMLSNIEDAQPDVIVMEIADGILQRETAMILGDPSFHRMVKGVLLAADSALSALKAIENLERLEYNVIAVSGRMTSSPLYTREFEALSKVPAISSARDSGELASAIIEQVNQVEVVGQS